VDSKSSFESWIAYLDGIELDSDGKLFMNQPTRVLRVCRGSGTLPEEMAHLLKTYRQMAEMVKTMGGKNGMLSMMGKPGMGGGAGGMGGGMPSAQQMARMSQQMRNNPQMARMAQMAQSMGMGKLAHV
jgi:signal recognition particle subunit SRP54